MAGQDSNVYQTETASMLDDLQIQIFVSTDLSNDGYKLKPTDSGYEEFKRRFGLQKPGDSKRIDSKLVNGEWVEIPVVEASFETNEYD